MGPGFESQRDHIESPIERLDFFVLEKFPIKVGIILKKESIKKGKNRSLSLCSAFI